MGRAKPCRDVQLFDRNGPLPYDLVIGVNLAGLTFCGFENGRNCVDCIHRDSGLCGTAAANLSERESTWQSVGADFLRLYCLQEKLPGDASHEFVRIGT